MDEKIQAILEILDEKLTLAAASYEGGRITAQVAFKGDPELTKIEISRKALGNAMGLVFRILDEFKVQD